MISLPRINRMDTQLSNVYNAKISFSLGRDFSKAISSALGPESKEIRGSSKLIIKNSDIKIHFDVITEDLSNLRAVINSNYLLIKASYETLNSLVNYRKRLSSNNIYRIKSE